MAKVPSERSLVRAFEGKPFVMLGVNADEPSDDLAQKTKDKGITWRSFQNGGPTGPITAAWGVTAFPSNYLIDHRGEIHAIDLEGEELKAEIELLVSQAEQGF